MRRWDRLVDDVDECRARGICPASVAHTESKLRQWGSWLKSRDAPDPRGDRSAATCAVSRKPLAVSGEGDRVWNALDDALFWRVPDAARGAERRDPLRWMKGPKVRPYNHLPRRNERAHMEALWRAAAAMQGEYSRRLWVTVLALLYGTGLRRGQLERLEIEAFDRTHATLTIDGRKSGRERRVPVSDVVYRCLEGYLPARHNLLERSGKLALPALLVSRRGACLTGQAISNGIHTLARRAKVPLVSLHQFRHSCASDLLEAGVHLVEVQRILGHQGIATTVRYTHIADPARRAAMTCHPINDFLQTEALAA